MSSSTRLLSPGSSFLSSSLSLSDIMANRQRQFRDDERLARDLQKTYDKEHLIMKYRRARKKIQKMHAAITSTRAHAVPSIKNATKTGATTSATAGKVTRLPVVVREAKKTGDDDVFDVLSVHRNEIRSFLSTNWKSERLGEIVEIKENPYSKPGQPLYERFLRAWQLVEDTTVQCVFHGTAECNIDPICRTGLDPKRRKGQAFGRGEYFATSATIPLAYVKGGRKLLVFAVLMDKSGLRRRAGNIVVIKKKEHQLPLFVVTFKKRRGVNSQHLVAAADVELSDARAEVTKRRQGRVLRRSSVPCPPPLPANWTKQFDARTKCVYYWNTSTNQSQWERPT